MIGHVISAARKKRNLTAIELAELCNVSRSVIYKWECSRFILPKNFKRLSIALGVSVRRLEEENGKDNRTSRWTEQAGAYE